MAVQLQLRRGTETENDGFTGALGEVTVDTTNKTIRVHDGFTVGGYPLVNFDATQTLTNKTLGSPTISGQITGNLIPSGDELYDLGSATNKWNQLYLAGSTIYLGDATISFDSITGTFSISYDGNTASLGVNTNQTFATLDGAETLTNKTYDSGVISGTFTGNASYSGLINFTNTADSSTPSTGALIVDGGVGIAKNITVGGNALIEGNLTVNGSTTTVESTTVVIEDPIFTLGGVDAPSADDSKDKGVEFKWHDGAAAKTGFFGFDRSTEKFTFIADGTNTSEVFSGTKGTLDATLEWADILNKPDPTITVDGDASGSVTLTDLASGTLTVTLDTVNTNVGTFGSATSIPVVTVDGKGLITGVTTATVSSTLPIAGDTGTDDVSLLTDTLTFSGTNGLSAAVTNNTVTFTSNATDVNTGSTIVLRDVSGNFSAGTITADLAGNASSASVWETGRTITLSGDVNGSVSIDGSSNVTITTTVAANSVALGTDTTGDYVAGATAGSGIVVSGTAGEGWSPTISHADTSSQASVDNAGGTVIQDITLDTFGHITAINSTDLDGRYYTESESDARFVNTDGDTLTGFLTLHANPTQSLHATTKQYVDEVAQGLQALPSAKGATTSNLSATYDNGTSGVGATLTSTANSAFPTVDDVTYEVGDNILVKDQTDASENGSYVLTTVGDASNPWVLTRCSFCDEPDEVAGAFEFVTNGTTYGGTGWVLTAATPITIGTTDLNWTQFSGAGTYTAGTGLALNGTQFAHADTSSVSSVNNSNNTFIQDLTFDTFGHVTGVTSGTVVVNDGTLTVNTSGTGLSGSGTFSANQSANNTITITSNATSANTASTIVSRDSSGNFSAGTITASLNGNASTAAEWATARTISLGGDLSGSVSIDGSANVTLTATVADDSHNHIISNIDGLQGALDSKLAATSYTAADILTKIKTVDGAGSGLDADLLDGQTGSYYLDWTNVTNKPDPTLTLSGDVSGSATFTNLGNATLTVTVADDSHNHIISNVDGLQNALDAKLNASSYTAADVLTKIKTVDGSGSGLDADLLDGLHESTFVRKSANSTLDMNNNDILGVDQIIHEGDTDTYMQFHASDEWRVVTGGVERLEVNNSVITSSEPINAPDFNSTSDIALKEDLEIIDDALNKVKQINGYTFTYKKDKTRAAGLIAQEIEKVLPEVVHGEDGNKSVSYGNVVGLLIEAIKEQQKEIDSLKEIINNKV